MSWRAGADRSDLKHYLVHTDEGIEKNKDFNLQRADVEKVKSAVKHVVSEARTAGQAPGVGGCNCSSCC
jgi:uncharacterized metal-binding protein